MASVDKIRSRHEGAQGVFECVAGSLSACTQLKAIFLRQSSVGLLWISEVNLVEACEESIQAIEKEYKDHSKINKFLVSDALHALRALREGRDSFIARFKKEEAAAKD